MSPNNRLDGKQILIVEDDYLLAADARKKILQLGANILGPVSSVDDALAILAIQDIDAAILDIELVVEDSYPIADALMAKGTPFVFASAVDRAQIPSRFEGYVLVSKPLELRLITEALWGPPH